MSWVQGSYILKAAKATECVILLETGGWDEYVKINKTRKIIANSFLNSRFEHFFCVYIFIEIQCRWYLGRKLLQATKNVNLDPRNVNSFRNG